MRVYEIPASALADRRDRRNEFRGDRSGFKGDQG